MSLRKALQQPENYLQGKYFLFTWLIFCCFLVSAQDISREDSLQMALIGQKDTVRVNTLNRLAHLYKSNEPEKALKYAVEALKEAERKNFKDGMATALHYIGTINYNQGNFEKGLNYFIRSLKIEEKIGNKIRIAKSLNNVGTVFLGEEMGEQALAYFHKALKIYQAEKDTLYSAATLTNMGNAYLNLKKTDQALRYYLNAYNLMEASGGKKSWKAYTLHNIGVIYSETGDTKRSLEYYKKALAMEKEIDDKSGIAESYNSIGLLYFSLKDYSGALENINKGLEMARSLGAKVGIQNAYLSLARIYEELNDHARAAAYYKKHIEMKDSLFHQEKTAQIAEMQAKYESEKKDNEIQLLNKDKALQQAASLKQKAEIEKQQTQRNGLIAGFSLTLVMSLFIYRSYRQKQKSNVEIIRQKQIIEEKNKDITDSIKYARRIQEAILPPDKIWSGILPDSFVYYRPKDILSGDFYWVEQDEEAVYVAAVDCTGHGVPGALMSIVGYNLLNKAVLEQGLKQPSEILNQLNKWLSITLHQSMSDSSVRDGMDISLCRINKNKKELHFAAAFNSLYYIRDGALKEIKGNKFPVGIFLDEAMGTFTNHQVPLKSGDMIYLFSDGYADQFGGEKGKKFKYSKLKELLLTISEKPLSEQKQILNETFETWKGNLEQVDDVCVIGVRI